MNKDLFIIIAVLVLIPFLDKFLDKSKVLNKGETMETFEVEKFVAETEKPTIEDYEIFKKIMRLYSLTLSRVPSERELYFAKKQFDEGKLDEQKLEIELKKSDEYKKLHPDPGNKYAGVKFEETSILTDAEHKQMLDIYKSIMKEQPKKQMLPFLQQKYVDLDMDKEKFIKFLTTTLEYKVKVAQNEIDPRSVARDIIVEDRPLGNDSDKEADNFNKMFEKNSNSKDDLYVSGNNVFPPNFGTLIDDAKEMTVGSILPKFHYEEADYNQINFLKRD